VINTVEVTTSNEITASTSSGGGVSPGWACLALIEQLEIEGASGFVYYGPGYGGLIFGAAGDVNFPNGQATGIFKIRLSCDADSVCAFIAESYGGTITECKISVDVADPVDTYVTAVGAYNFTLPALDNALVTITIHIAATGTGDGVIGHFEPIFGSCSSP
jgi:hypothetical protein